MKRSRSAWISSALLTVCVTSAPAAPISLTLNGATAYDGWNNLTYANGYSGVSFPGTGAWKTSGGDWTSYDPGTGAVGAIGSNTGGSGDALLYKIGNGAAGGPYPAGSSIYFGGASAQVNYDGGTLGFADATPLSELKTVAFQVELGEAFGYDFFNHTLPVLTYTTESGTSTITASYSDLISQIYSGSITMPSGLEDIYKNTWGLQYDLSGVSETILSYQVSFTGVQHAQLYSAQMDQSTAAYESILFPQAAAWSAAGADDLWSNGANWSDGTAPVAGKEVAFGTGSGVTLDSDRSVAALTLDAASGFTIRGTDRVLTVGEGGIVASAAGAADHTIESKVTLGTFNLITVEENNSLTLAGDVTGPGFYKKGDGNLNLSGNNTFTGNAYNQVIFMGGVNSITGTNTNAGSVPLELYVKNAVVNLKGGDERFGPGFGLNLYSRQFTDGSSVLGEENAFLVLGDASGKSDQTFDYIRADGANIFNEATGLGSTGAFSNSAIRGGSSQVSTLTVDTKTYDPYNVPAFLGKLGGDGLNENNLSLVKDGSGVQALGGTSTYTGDTVIRGGMLRIDNAAALSASSNVRLEGGVLGLGAGDLQLRLGTGAGEVQFTGDGGFAAFGGITDGEGYRPRRVVTLNDNEGLVWGSGGFVGDGHKLILSHAGADNGVELTNAIDFGSRTRTIQVDNGTDAVDARLSGVLSGSGGLVKTGTGVLVLSSANTYGGGTVVKAGNLTLGGYEGSIRGDVLVEAGATLRLANQGTDSDYYGDRIEDTAVVTLKGGTLDVNNNGVADGSLFSEAIGKVVLSAGANVISTARNGIIAPVGSTPDGFDLALGSLERQQGATVHFAGPGLGVDNRNRILVGSAPALDDGIIGGWATTGTGTAILATEFVTYGANGLTALSSYTSYTAAASDSSWGTASNIKLNAGTGAGFTSTLTANRAINSLNMIGARTGTLGNNLNLGGNTLRVESGGIIGSGGATTRSNKIDNGFLTAGTGVNTNAELFVTASGATQIGAAIIDNGTGKVTLVKTGVNTLTLNAANTYTGATIVNQGSLVLGANGSIANSSVIQVNQGGVLNVTAVTNFTVGSDQVLKGLGTINGAVAVAGKLASGNSVGTINFTDALALTAGSNFEWEIESEVDGGAAFDVVNVGGTLSISDSTTFSILSSVADFSTDYWSEDRSFLVIAADEFGGDYSGSDPFQLETNGAGEGYGTWGLAYGADGVRVQWTAVPEPSTAAVFGGLGALLLLKRRRRAGA